MVAYMPTNDFTRVPARQQALAHELFHGLSPEEFDQQAKAVAKAEAMTPEVRARMKAHLVERLMTPPDRPSWGPDWVRKGEKVAARPGKGKLALLFNRQDEGEDDSPSATQALDPGERDEAQVIVRNMEKSRQIWHYRWLYVAALIIALVIAAVAMFVDYQIIRGDVWTRALANEFMVVPAALQSTLVFKSLQVIFAVLIVHFMLKITGVYGRNALVATAFVFALIMIGGLGYLVAYNNMTGGTQATLEHKDDAPSSDNAIDRLFTTDAAQSQTAPATEMTQAGMIPAKASEFSLPLPKLSQKSLADADSWFWLAFASVIFFIVTVVAALYLQSVENNARNFLIARDYKHRKRQFAQLHLLDLADHKMGFAGSTPQ